MTVSFILRCDGRREYIEQAIASAENSLKANFEKLFIVDDSGDQDYAFWLEQTFPAYECIHHNVRLGMNECARSMIKAAIASGSDYVWSTEDDFVYPHTVNVKKMCRLLHCEPHLGQLTLKRNPVNDVESAAGGFMEAFPELYSEHSCPTANWVESSQIMFSGNPSLVRVSALVRAVDVAMPDTDTYEVPVGKALRDVGYVLAFYGKIEDEPRTIHLGDTRSSGYHW